MIKPSSPTWRDEASPPGGKNDRRSRHATLQDRLDALPAPATVSAAVAAQRFDDALDRRGKVTMAQIEATGAVSRKTILKHIGQGHLSGTRELVQGRPTWLFEPEEARRYLEVLAALLHAAVHHKANRPTRITGDAGYVTIREAAEACGVSHWTVREHLARLGIKVRIGRHRAHFIADQELPRMRAHFDGLAHPQSQRGEPGQIPKGRAEGGPYFGSFDVLWAVLVAQPELTNSELRRISGASAQTVRRWVAGARIPDNAYRGSLIAFFRERYLCRLSDDLAALAEMHRRDYFRQYVAERRTDPAFAAAERRSQAEYREANRELLAAKERARYARQK